MSNLAAFWTQARSFPPLPYSGPGGPKIPGIVGILPAKCHQTAASCNKRRTGTKRGRLGFIGFRVRRPALPHIM